MTIYNTRQQRLIEEHRDINVGYDWSENTIAEFARQLDAYGIDITTHDVKLMNGETRQDPDVFWSGFWSQGDGASFHCRPISLVKVIQAGQKVMSLPDDDDLSYLKDSTEPVPTALREMFQRLEREYGTCLLSGEAMAVVELASINVATVRGHYSHSGNMIVELDWQGDEKEDYSETDQQLISRLEEERGRMRDTLRGLADALYRALEKEHEHLTEDEQVWDAIVADGLDKPDTDDEEERNEEGCLAA